MNLKRVKRAIISVSDKSNLKLLLPILKRFNIEIISSGGTFRKIRSMGYKCIEVSNYTGFSEILDGRVKTLHPKIYAGILSVRKKKKHKKDLKKQKIPNIDLVIVDLYPFEKKLKDKGVITRIIGREKTPFSIWRKMQSRRVSLEQLTDIIGFRIIVNDIETCYKALGIFHSNWSTIPGKFKDYISTPKINSYKSIHTAVIGPNKERIEIQIRTKQMHDFAERGIASHWVYKSSEKITHLALKEYDWLRDLVEIMEKETNTEHSLEYTKLQMFQEYVFCFTPKGEIIKLPRGATPIDFAYAVHTKVGDNIISCEINGRGSPLQSSLKNGDLVNIIGSKNSSPSLQWLSYARTGKARAAIRRYWQNKTSIDQKSEKKYLSSLQIKIPNVPGKLGEVSSLIGFHLNNIINMEIVDKKKDYIEFIFDIQINDLKNYKNLISELKLKEYKFSIIRHRKKDALLQRIFKNFKRN